MAYLRTDRVPASFGEHVWHDIKDVVEVTDAEAHDLLAIADAEFHEVIDHKPTRRAQVTEPDPDIAPVATHAATKKK